ncbi:TFIIH/NER complex subunit TFB1 KNAG_0B04650 [Huiozyma naganishii CBS 8797]|uniref:BSD domain-containing protein n=1 Tax=Huiozyma naganishii (strain ATCC MYA-139 / BCRC 22969 / CBS 8797 / KCTC 17520 / NBRC 10181 / NCYC 3082 / Yp74L-3) TaxID=1071383 RepID=J7R257_HUIN7|nr:hypothetical protein KNAG_0B04650 [Kazachstania naganishii CBS 8797]CCK68900.1 hypothetical protein KNAG_0B04650 [Kazachstania naganishii CBS 8797]
MSHSGAATYKKVHGIITIDEDAAPAQLTWRSTDGDKSHVIVLDTIDKLQATPGTSEKMMLRLMSKVDENKNKRVPNGEEVPIKPVTHMFTFNNRDVMDNIKLTLQQIISRYKDIEMDEERREREASGTAEEQQDQQQQQNYGAPLINTAKLDDSLSKGKLMVNLKLQQSLLKKNKDLMKTFQETVMNSGLPPDVFWSTRIPLLRAFALSTSQKVGPYNVLSTIKPVASSENKVNVNLSRQKIYSIFETYPIVKKAYDDNVPKNFKEQEFWARFFSSKLFRKLRGEKLMQNHRGDVIIDRYLTLDQEYDRKEDEMLSHPVTKFIDIQGNKEDDPVKMGNRPDFTMQPGMDVNGNNDGTVDILKGMNRLSEKMIMALENEYSRSNLQRETLDQVEKENIEINDLEKAYEAQYALIHLKTAKSEKMQNSLAPADSNRHADIQVGLIPAAIKTHITSVIDELTAKLDLTKVVSEIKGNSEINQRVVAAVKINAKQAKHNNIDPMLGSFIGSAGSEEAKTDIPQDLLESCRILHSTCCEFLKHFYIHFQSGEYKRGQTVNELYTHLKDCNAKLNELFEDVLREDGESMANSCTAYLKPTMDSILFAVKKYEDAFEAANREVATKGMASTA